MSNTAKLKTKCGVTGRDVILFAECPPLQLKQILRFASTPTDAVAIAESRWKEANRIRKARLQKSYNKYVDSFQ